jgi:sugar lactone lactonase YvrE
VIEELPASVIAAGLVFPECPRWHADRLYLSDVHAHRVVELGPGGELSTVVELPGERPSGLGFAPDGTLLVATHRARHVVGVVDGELRTVADLSAFGGDYLNDMVVDRLGRAYVGARVNVRYGGPAGVAGPGEGVERILVASPDGSVRVAADTMVAPNGMVITEEGDRLIAAETHAHRLTEFDIAPDGTLHDRRVFADLGAEVWPDGIALDVGGGVWVGSPELGQFLRVERGATVTHRVRAVGGWAVACALGGADRRTLFMVTTRTTLEDLNRVHADISLDAASRSEGFIEMAAAPFAGTGLP